MLTSGRCLKNQSLPAGKARWSATHGPAFDDATGHNHTGTGGNGTKIGSAALSFAWADNETVAVDGTVGPFALAQSPSPAGSLLLIVEGQVQIAGSGNDYQLSGGNVTFEATRNPPSGSDVRAFYRYSA